MIALLLTLLTAQVTPTPAGNLILDAAPFKFTRIAVTENTLAVSDENDAVVHLFGLDGKLKATLGKGDHSFQLPQSLNWITGGNLMVFDAADRSFSEWTTAGELVKHYPTELDSFFQVGPLISVPKGYIASVSLTEEKFLLALFDTDFTPVQNKYQIAKPALADMSPDLYQTFTAVSNGNSDHSIFVAQSLSKRVDIFDGELRLLRNFKLNPKGWREAKLSRLAKVSKNPKELRKYRTKFSEIVALAPLSGKRLVVGFRNVSGAKNYGYQVIHLDTGSPMGDIMPSTDLLIGSHADTLYLKQPDSKNMVLKKFKVQ